VTLAICEFICLTIISRIEIRKRHLNDIYM